MPIRTADEWVKEYVAREAYWLHDGNKKRPHALLTSGLHSDGFFNSKPVIADPDLLEEVAHGLVEKLLEQSLGGVLDVIDRVVGPATGATELAKRVAADIARRRGRSCAWASPQKAGEGARKSMVFDDPMLGKPEPREIVWRVEDVLTTGGSIEAARRAVMAEGGVVLESVGVIVNRSNFSTFSRTSIIALVDKPMSAWEAGDCPLCAGGSEAIRPKASPENWARLNAEY